MSAMIGSFLPTKRKVGPVYPPPPQDSQDRSDRDPPPDIFPWGDSKNAAN